MERNTARNSILTREHALIDTSLEDFLWTNYSTPSPSPVTDKQFPFFSGYLPFYKAQDFLQPSFKNIRVNLVLSNRARASHHDHVSP